jgi:hypothetical protein
MDLATALRFPPTAESSRLALAALSLDPVLSCVIPRLTSAEKTVFRSTCKDLRAAVDRQVKQVGLS